MTSIKESIVEIQLSQHLAFWYSYGNNNTNGGRLDHWTKCLKETHPWALMKAFYDQLGLVSLYCAIWISFDAEDPLIT